MEVELKYFCLLRWFLLFDSFMNVCKTLRILSTSHPPAALPPLPSPAGAPSANHLLLSCLLACGSLGLIIASCLSVGGRLFAGARVTYQRLHCTLKEVTLPPP